MLIIRYRAVSYGRTVCIVNRRNERSEKTAAHTAVLDSGTVFKTFKTNRCFLELILDLLHCGCLGSLVVRAPVMRSGCRGFDSHSGHI